MGDTTTDQSVALDQVSRIAQAPSRSQPSKCQILAPPLGLLPTQTRRYHGPSQLVVVLTLMVQHVESGGGRFDSA